MDVSDLKVLLENEWTLSTSMADGFEYVEAMHPLSSGHVFEIGNGSSVGPDLALAIAEAAGSEGLLAREAKALAVVPDSISDPLASDITELLFHHIPDPNFLLVGVADVLASHGYLSNEAAEWLKETAASFSR